MAIKTNTCESSAAAGAFVLTSNSANPDAWNSVTTGTGTDGVYVSTNFPAHGTKGIKYQTTSVSTVQYTQWTTDGNQEQYARVNYRHNATPTANVRIFQLGSPAGSCLDLELRTDNTIRLRDSSGASVFSSAVMAVGQNYRIEVYGNCLASTGTARLRIYSGYDGSSLFSSYDSTNNLALRSTPTFARFGIASAVTNTLLYMDDFALRSDQFPGPVAAPNVAPAVAAPIYRAVKFPKTTNLTTTATDSDGGTLAYAYSVLWVSDTAMMVTISGAGATRTIASTYPGATVIRCTVTDGQGGTTVVDHVVEFANEAWIKTSVGYKPATLKDFSSTSLAARTDLPGWILRRDQLFNVDAAEGEFLTKYPYMEAAPTSYQTTHGQPGPVGVGSGDHYGGAVNLSVANGYFTARVFREAAGTCIIPGNSTTGHAVGAAPWPRFSTTPNDIFQLYGRYEVEYRIRSNGSDPWTTAWLTYPRSNNNLADGEIDFREGTFTGGVNLNMHRRGATAQGDQYSASFPAGTNDGNWHTVILEWKPNYCAVYSDGALIGSTTTRVPNVEHRMALQTETLQSGSQPGVAPATAFFDIRRIAVWRPA